MYRKFLKVYSLLFSRVCFEKLNFLFFDIGLHGLGILNCQRKITGESSFLDNYLKKRINPIVFDIGANEGDYCKKVIKANGNVKLLAFEPHPDTFNRLVYKFMNFDSIYFYNFAFGDKIEKSKLYDYKNSKGTSHASKFKDVIRVLHDSNFDEYNIQSLTLDYFVENNSIESIDLIKIDTEGSEFNILLGGIETIRLGKVKAIHFEFNEMNVFSKKFFKDFWDLLSDYKLYRMLPKGLLRIDKYSPIKCEIFAYQNIVAILNQDDCEFLNSMDA